MPTVRLNGEAITSWDAFHDESQRLFGFPEFYGRNMNAWVDCLSYLRDDDGMSTFRLKPDEVLRIEVQQAEHMRAQAPEILDDLAFCIEAINDRYADYGEKPALELILL
ncbi:barstar family protein [Herminiimonas sp. CN]|uniref:barstar family protein n=1 Tax=Herminiimonas sp. CN TaxID=1349818 RepID=UPI0004737F44|nr:barstar family protein [Herminiimonas sp. CN]